MNTTDLIGKKFGKLIVIRFDHIEHKRDKNGKNRDKGFWLCKCDCGNEVTVSRNVLVTGDKKSCGCLHKEMFKKNARNKVIDLTGKRINKLFVMGLEKIECKKTKNGENKNIYYWRCRCDCGQEVVVNGNRLREGKVKDCKEVINNQTKSYTRIGNEYKKENILKEGTRLDFLNNKISRANTSGVRGVSFKKDKMKYKATIGFKGKTYFLGYFSNIEDAKKAREKAEEKYYKPILKKYSYNKIIEESEEEFE